MPNTFKNYFLKNAGTTAANVYAPAAATQATVIGFTIGNTTASPITANVIVGSGATTHFMVQNAIISNGGALVPIGGDQKLVLEFGDYLQVQTSASNSADCILSVLEIT
jgi:hypothetical protein|tara:strand:+ start:147 stop:473 length:327 start_codon:yes stop_codon:yes gene_type:complete